MTQPNPSSNTDPLANGAHLQQMPDLSNANKPSSSNTTCPDCGHTVQWHLDRICSYPCCERCHTGYIEAHDIEPDIVAITPDIEASKPDPIIGRDVTDELTTEVRGHKRPDGTIVITGHEQYPTITANPDPRSAGTDDFIEPLDLNIIDDKPELANLRIGLKLNEVISYINDHNNPKEVKDNE